ncbi:LPXTG-motif cell wall-anchored protein [Bacillus sp. SORGH_AS 510]|uniref:TasA family protein n=1 Tax=Bacillus sp. SORGH_AS_0510 TaxID=3041771 RepID=UPI002780493F|nr:TasA family protein [Bacillus sp. SORGH_AS_0510]MDQ1145371.1 LPXTG-motif cell wall-anchored protein [Bacillus sp. SORGH_AS_0510]
MKKLISSLLIGVFAFGLIFSSSIIKTSAASKKQEIDIATSPEKILFDITNFKPGDWAERTLEVQNSGKQDFNYLSSSKLKEGSEKFYNELLLKISDENTVLFEGKMKDFNKLDSRFIAKDKSEKLFFMVKVPEELGNEFQGLGCEVQFKFYVEGTLGGTLPVNGPKLPETGTNMFNIIVAGAVLLLTGSILQFLFSRKRKSMERRV